MKYVRCAITMWTLASTASCYVSHPDYPSGWDPEVPPAQRSCSDISGTYSDYGVMAFEGRFEPVSLALAFFTTDQLATSPDHVELVLAQDRLRVEVSSETGPIASMQVPQRVHCDHGDLVFTDVEAAADVFMGAGTNETRMHLAQDGALVVRSTETAVGLAMLIPVAVSGRAWMTFPRLDARPMQRNGQP